MNEENNKKRNKIIIIVAVLFLLTAGIMTVYSFKNTKAEEIESFTINSDLVVLPPFYELMDKNYSGIKLNENGSRVYLTTKEGETLAINLENYVASELMNYKKDIF